MLKKNYQKVNRKVIIRRLESPWLNFVKASQVTSLTDIALVIIYFVERKRGKKWFFIADLRTWFMEALIPPPANLHDVVSRATKSQFLIPDKTSNRMRYRLSQKGIDKVEKQLEQVGLLAQKVKRPPY